MKFAVGADEYAPLVEAVVERLQELGHKVDFRVPDPGETLAWPSVAKVVAEAVASGKADSGVLFCFTGTGVAMAANKVPGVRAALCGDTFTAMGARKWNNANVLAMSLRATSETVGLEILQGWLDGEISDDEDDLTCLRLLNEMDGGSRPAQPARGPSNARPKKSR
jgi:ribose 5-phosphate isomerase B